MDRTAARSACHTLQREPRAPVLYRCIITTSKPPRDTGQTHDRCVRGGPMRGLDDECPPADDVAPHRRWSSPCRSAFIRGPFPDRAVWGLVVTSTVGVYQTPVARIGEWVSGVACSSGN